jgi:hypothetical protein
MKLFDSSSVSVVSERFNIGKQTTIYATGLAAGDEISFEMVTLDDVPVSTSPSCPAACDGGYPMTQAVVVGATALTCCGNVAGTAIKLVMGRSHIVIDSPQNVWVRAIYSGTNLGNFIVWEEASDVANVTEAMRGCCVVAATVSGTASIYPVAAAMGPTGILTLTMSNGSTIVSNEPAYVC